MDSNKNSVQNELNEDVENLSIKSKTSPILTMRKMQSLIRDYRLIDSSTGIITMSIVNLLNIQKADNILECGCGQEYSLPYICGVKKPSSNLYMTDFQEVKLRKIKQKVQLLEDHPLCQDLYDHKLVPDIEFQQKYESKKLKIIVELADATQLSYPSNMFDSYYGGLLLDEVQEPQRIVMEAYRVLKKGGRAGFTVFSEKDEKEYEVYKIIDDAYLQILQEQEDSIKQNESLVKKTRKASSYTYEELDSFYLEIYQIGSRAKIQKYLQLANFQNILIWESFVPVQCYDVSHFNECFEVFAQDQNWDPDLKQKVFELSKCKYYEKMQETNQPFGFTVICAVAQKL
ncbi:hypothetical protein ABPG74_022739 [Tetrahymena malaccensis]